MRALTWGEILFFLPEGFDAKHFYPMSVEKRYQVSFVGEKYGRREQIVRKLRSAGIPVSCFGSGWENPPVYGKDFVEVLNSSVVNLGIGLVQHSNNLVNLKTRDFEVPGTGGGAYVTTYNPDLCPFFNIGEEIFCYRTIDDLIEIIRDLLRNPEKSERASKNARARSLKEHRWLHRYISILEILGILGNSYNESESVTV